MSCVNCSDEVILSVMNQKCSYECSKCKYANFFTYGGAKVPDLVATRNGVTAGRIENSQRNDANGPVSCSHYKQSHRLFRFDCCRKIYPCLRCHDDQEDHKSVYASSMICGFCKKQQPSDFECRYCKKALTKRHTNHWNGGKGCRDRSKLDKKDRRYRPQN